nr:sensory histidine kinase UhpB [Streptococcus thermophilus]
MMRTRLPFITDIAVPCLIVALLWIPRPEHVASTADAALGAVLCALAVAATALSRRFPAAMPVVLFAATVAGWSLGLIRDPFIAFSWSIIPLGIRHWRAIRRWLPVLWIGVIASLVIAVDGLGTLAVAPVAVLVSLIIAETEGRQRNLETREAEAAFAHYTARELHDGIGHSLSVIRAEAGVGLMLPSVATRDDVRDVLTRIESQAESAMASVAEIVDVYGEGAADGADTQLSIRDAIAADRAAGLSVTVHGAIPEREVPVRIVQEMLRNARKHSADGHCELSFGHRGDEWLVSCTNAVSSPLGEGHGLKNLETRALALGGSAQWDIHDGVFRIEVRVPGPSHRKAWA